MIAFLIKSSVSMLVFLLFYKLVLEREKMHRINRFLLIFALVFSVVIPFVSFELISENPIVKQSIPSYILPEIYIGNQEAETTKLFTSETVFRIIYGLGFLVFLFRFVWNLTSILRRIHESETIKKDGFTLVLIQDEMLPHSFWNWVFVNRNEYENDQINEELFVHEKAHVTQKHSLDILFVEVLQMVFWFSPIIYLYKKAIKLNHEFLADQKVNETFRAVVHYQKLLLQKSVGNSLVPIASNLNYSITKKRFIMMTKSTSRFRMLLKMTFSTVIFSFLILACSKAENLDKSLTKEEIDEILTTIKDKKPKDFTDEQWNALYQDYLYRTKNEESFTAIPFKTVEEFMEATEGVNYEDGLKTVTGNYKEDVYESVHISPTYPGGMNEFRKFVAKNYNLPNLEKDLKGKVLVQFVVEEDGSLSDIKTVRDLGYGTGEEAIRVLKLSEKWKPGILDGKPVRVRYTLPIDLNITSK